MVDQPSDHFNFQYSVQNWTTLREATGATNPDTGNAIYVGKSGVVSRGVEFEVNGALTDNWQMTFGGTTYVAEDRDGENYNTACHAPRSTCSPAIVCRCWIS
ncbi:hypothetical protein LZ023_37975 (plasmid) [Pseudomonas silvicola]|nr:hypothetical protein LZ023_37975 [Pseudomonas silvicola]